jgi:acetyl-CoA carboxylase biotin carboxyl carrier protein
VSFTRGDEARQRGLGNRLDLRGAIGGAPEETRDYLIRMLDVHRLRLLESMKMEIPVIAEDAGVLKELRVAPGVAVTEHQVVALIEA